MDMIIFKFYRTTINIKLVNDLGRNQTWFVIKLMNKKKLKKVCVHALRTERIGMFFVVLLF